MERDPCPDRILDDIGGAFGMGAVGGGAFYFLKGLKNSPRGSRLLGAYQTARMKTPATAGGFAVWGALFSLSDCSLVYLRQKEDPWNSIMAGAFTGGFLQMRQGFASASRAALIGGGLLALIEGLQIAVNRFVAAQQQQIIYVDRSSVPIGMGHQGNQDLPETAGASGSASWFGGWFGGGGKKEEETSGAKTEILESFDAPLPPTFEFK
ncbi:mitochondrial import inner membrane translocase subunit TIM17-1-like [Coffea arabica]|uniref:Mitochondrial import inner membrane translocase subunit TIM17-1-like n=1 Tax=Coffea arabica TaxID=13443 RepID=A0A6P6UYF3_COFAR|nr:mitochondrial import inner membrane translocase subunit TIM17-2-like [Coffea arabica]XP_027100116.1 mitochondrial import inner membrane translocase subunit TIM17-2-like [Coffea arabica]